MATHSFSFTIDIWMPVATHGYFSSWGIVAKDDFSFLLLQKDKTSAR
jgi:hypothetical protein